MYKELKSRTKYHGQKLKSSIKTANELEKQKTKLKSSAEKRVKLGDKSNK